MSDLQVALVAEGKTDQIIIEAALKAILNRSFVLTLLQPETSDPFGAAGPHGGGWGGVYRWCRKIVSMPCPVVENPSLAGFDLIILHLDADVAGMRYENANVEEGRTDLPCELDCPPAVDTVDVLRMVVTRWLNLPTMELPGRWVFCNPSKCTEAWVVVACHIKTAPLIISDILPNIECNPDLTNWLSNRPIGQRALIRGGKKQTSVYKKVAPQIEEEWGNVIQLCTQALRFQEELQTNLEGV